MRESIRQDYLMAFGIDSYQAIYQLPFAKVSTILPVEWLDTASEPIDNYSSTIDKTDSLVAVESISPIDLQALLASSVLLDPPLKKDSIVKYPKLESLAVEPKDADLVSFKLAIYQIADCLIVDGNSENNLLIDRLAQNVGQCITGALTTGEKDIWEWPLMAGGFIENNRVNALSALKAYLDVRFDLKTFSTVLLMGSNAQQYVLDSDLDQIHLWSETQIHFSSVRVLITASLSELLKSDIDKKALQQLIFKTGS